MVSIIFFFIIGVVYMFVFFMESWIFWFCVCVCWGLVYYWCSWFILYGVYIIVILYISSWMNCFVFSNDIYFFIIIVECSICIIYVKEFDL